MGIARSINSLLNHEIKIDLERQIDRKKAFAILGVLVIFLAVTGYVIGDRWFWINNKSFYEYKIDSLKQELRKQPNSDQIRVDLAMADYLNGEVDKSIGILRNILNDEPDNGPAVLYLGLILAEQKEYRDSIGLLKGYIEKNQGFEVRMAYQYLGRDYLAVGKTDLALTHLKYAAVRDPGNPVVFYYLGQTYEKDGDKKNAIANYEKALRISPDYAEAGNALQSLLKHK